MTDQEIHGGSLVAEVLAKHGVKFVFTLCGGHISPILVASKQKGIRVVDVRHEVTTVFAADAVARLSGIPGVAAVTAGPGLTNTITAIKNAQMAQSPVIVLGGATATLLKGRGSLQDIDQIALIKPHVKWWASIKKVSEIIPTLEQAFAKCQSDIPGPVFIEYPVDLLYPESIVREWYGAKSGTKSKSFFGSLVQWYIKRHVEKIFAHAFSKTTASILKVNFAHPNKLNKASQMLANAQKPVLLVGSQTMLLPKQTQEIQQAVNTLKIPTYLSGMARGLLGQKSSIQLRHKRRNALKEADLVILAGVPCDFRLDYGRHLSSKAKFIAINRGVVELKKSAKNRRPTLEVVSDPGEFLMALAKNPPKADGWPDWLKTLQDRDAEREKQITEQASETVQNINPISLCCKLEQVLPENSIIVADGGDFVATSAYTLRPRGPLTWLDPGAFGTLGVGAGFALGAKLCHPDSHVWVIFGDGSVGYSLTEWDTFVRHNIAITAVVGNDASWQQIARDQIVVLKDDVGTVLSHTDYHKVAQSFGGEGLIMSQPQNIDTTLEKALQMSDKALLINAIIGKTDFRKGSISI